VLHRPLRPHAPRLTRALAPLLAPLLASLLASPARATPAPGVAPPQREWVSYLRRPAQPVTLSADVLSDPKALLEALRQNPDALSVERMPDAGVATEVARVLLEGAEGAQAVGVLARARARWPDDTRVTHAWARTVINLGAASYARAPLSALLERLEAGGEPSGAPDVNYTRYLLALCFFLEGADDPRLLAQSATLLDEVVRLNPAYVGPDGVTADNLRAFSADIRARAFGGGRDGGGNPHGEGNPHGGQGSFTH